MKKTLPLVLIAAFVLVDVVLIVGAQRHVFREPPASGIVAAAPTPTVGAPAQDPANAQVAYDFDADRSVSISLANDGALVFGARAKCDSTSSPVSISYSVAGGAKVKKAATELVTVLGAKASSKTDVRVVGQDASCDVVEVRSTNGGSSWTTSDSVSVWYADPQDGNTVVSPVRSANAGCEVVSVSQVTQQSARVGCVDGTIKGSGDSGKTWTKLGRLDNLRVVTFLTPTAGHALARYNGCAANAFTTKDAGVTWQPGGCITGEPAQGIAASANGLVAVVNDGLYASPDGTTWNQP